jgi:hypothetical protein
MQKLVKRTGMQKKDNRYMKALMDLHEVRLKLTSGAAVLPHGTSQIVNTLCRENKLSCCSSERHSVRV